MPTIKQKRAFKEVGVNGGNISKAMRAAGYSPSASARTDKLTQTRGWKELIAEHLGDDVLAKTHRQLLDSNQLDHMVFPLGPKGKDDEIFSGGGRKKDKEKESGDIEHERTTLTDEEIIALLKEVNCHVRRIVHGESARHVYFWAPDNRSRKDGLDMAYKLKGSYAPEKSLTVNIDVGADPELEKQFNDFRKKQLRQGRSKNA